MMATMAVATVIVASIIPVTGFAMITAVIPMALPSIIAIIAMVITIVTRLTIPVIGTHSRARSPADPGTDQLAIATTNLIADGGTTQGTDSATQRRFILVAPLGRCRTTQRTTDGRARQSTVLTGHLFTYDGARDPGHSAAQGGIQIFSGIARSNQQTGNNTTRRTKFIHCHDGRLPVVISLIGG